MLEREDFVSLTTSHSSPRQYTSVIALYLSANILHSLPSSHWKQKWFPTVVHSTAKGQTCSHSLYETVTVCMILILLVHGVALRMLPLDLETRWRAVDIYPPRPRRS